MEKYWAEAVPLAATEDGYIDIEDDDGDSAGDASSSALPAAGAAAGAGDGPPVSETPADLFDEPAVEEPEEEIVDDDPEVPVDMDHSKPTALRLLPNEAETQPHDGKGAAPMLPKPEGAQAMQPETKEKEDKNDKGLEIAQAGPEAMLPPPLPPKALKADAHARDEALRILIHA